MNSASVLTPSIESLAPSKKVRRNRVSVHHVDFSDPDAVDAWQEELEIQELRGRVSQGYSLKMLPVLE